MIRIKADINEQLQFSQETVSLAKGMLTVGTDTSPRLSISIKEIEKASVEEALGIAKLVIKKKSGEELEVAYFTKPKVKNFRKFADAVNQYVEKE